MLRNQIQMRSCRKDRHRSCHGGALRSPVWAYKEARRSRQQDIYDAATKDKPEGADVNPLMTNVFHRGSSRILSDVLGLVNNWVIYKIDEATIRRLKSYIPNSDESLRTHVRALGPGQALVSIAQKKCRTTLAPGEISRISICGWRGK